MPYIFPILGGVHSTAHTHFIFLPYKVFLEIVSEKSRYSLHQNMDKIKVPTQIIWGKQDQVCGVSLGLPAPVAPASKDKLEVRYEGSLAAS